MEFLRTCSTNAQAIPDFEAVAYQAFSVKRNPPHAAATTTDRHPLDDLRLVEATLREEQRLVVQDASRPWLWLFCATTVDQVGQPPQNLPVLDGYELRREQSGVAKASELARPPIPLRSTSLSTPTATTANSPLTPGPLKGSQTAGLRLFDQHQPHDIFVIHELFTSSVIALILHYLVKHHDAIALNYRSFLSNLSSQHLNIHGPNLSRAATRLTSINVYWASSGTLLVSFFTVAKPDIRSLGEITALDGQKQLLGSCIRLAPNGCLAQLVSLDTSIGTATEEVNTRAQRKRLKPNPIEQGIEKWKILVTRWLSWKGYSLQDLDKHASWVKIRPAQLTHASAPSPSPSSSSRDVPWPKALCFFYDRSAASDFPLDSLAYSTSTQDYGDWRWFQTTQSTGFRDPVDVAQQWAAGKTERDKIFEARKRAQKAEDESNKPKEEHPGGLFPSSPLNSRTGVYGDLQAVSGVYPTPPDGVPPGTAISSGDTPSISGIVSSTVLVPGGTNPAINLSMPQDKNLSDEHQQTVTSPEFPMPYDNFNSSAGNDDLFEDMDEDEFDGHGVTDADFNFFDEPDGDDVDMADAPPAQQEVVHNSKVPGKKEPLIVTEVEVKEDMSDPMAALEDALASAADPPVDEPVAVKLEKDERSESMAAPPQDHEIIPQAMRFAKSAIPNAHKEPTPPLSPQHIQQRLLSSPKHKAVSGTPEKLDGTRDRDSVFDPVSFSKMMSLSDAKYSDGRFSFQHGKQDVESKKKRRPASLRDLPLLTKLRYAAGIASHKNMSVVSALARGDSDFTDSSSETSSAVDDDVEEVQSLPLEPPSATVVGPLKRKMPTDGNATPLSALSFADSFGGDSFDFTMAHVDEGSIVSFEPSPWDWSLINVPPPTELQFSGRYTIPSFSYTISSIPNTPTSQSDQFIEPADDKTLGPKDRIAVAQIVTEQIVSSTLDLLQDALNSNAKSRSGGSDRQLRTAIRALFSKATHCTVSGLMDVTDVFPDLLSQMKGQQRATPRRPNDAAATPGSQLYQMNSPHIRVRRADTKWDVLPPALSFWDSLGLSPCSLAKDVGVVCIYPHSDSLRPCLEHFMTNLQIAYDSCKLGSHDPVETLADFEGGLIPWKIDHPTSARSAFKTLREACMKLGRLLSSRHAQMKDVKDANDGQTIDAFVIYMIDPFETPSSIWELCSAFWSLFQTYGQGPPSRPDQVPKPDLVLQIIPIRYVASFDVPVILDASVYATLAREVYDRCPPSAPCEDKTPLSIYAAPSFQLEESLPRNIHFKLHSDPPQDLIRENSYMHLGYAISSDGAWITAAWTDSCGKSRAMVSYNLGTRAFSEIAKEIWATTIEIIQARRVHWRVCIAKAGVLDKEEFDAWVSLAAHPVPFNLFVTLLTVDINPPLKFTPSTSNTNPPATANAQASSTTPGSTPQASISPDPHSLTPAATPSADTTIDPLADPEARLVDVTDESWGIILSHRLHNTNSTIEFRPCLISGLLVKRGQTLSSTTSSSTSSDAEYGPIIVGVNIIWVGAVSPSRAANPSNATPTTPSPFTPAGDGVSPGGQNPAQFQQAATPSQDTGRQSLMWTPTPQHRNTAETLLKEVMSHFRALGVLARLRGVSGSRMGTVPWHVAVAKRGVDGLGRCMSGNT